MAKLQRKYKLEVQNVFGGVTTIEPPFSLDFDIEKNIPSTVSTGSMTVYNLGQTTRDEIYKDVRQVGLADLRLVNLYAGYEGETLSKIFTGTISHCYSRRIGTEFLTTIEVNSGSDFLANSYVSLEVPKDTPVRDYMATLVSQIRPQARRAIGNFEGTFKRSCQASGMADKLIKEYCDGNFFVDGDTVLVLKENEAIEGVLNIIDADSGLIGTPQREETFLLFDILFEPRILLGQYIELKSSSTKYFNGQFKVVGFHHSGTISEAICGTAKTTVRVQFFPTDGRIIPT